MFDSDEQYWIGVANDKTDAAKAYFYRKFSVDKRATEIEGHPVTTEVERVKILVPGDDKSQIDRKVQDEDKKRWPEAYERFKNKERPGIAKGTPIREWPYLSREWVAKLEFLNVHTVEEIVNASDSALERIGPGSRDLQKRAKEFLTPASENEQNWRKEKLDLEARIKALEANLRAADDVPEEDRPRRGRKAA